MYTFKSASLALASRYFLYVWCFHLVNSPLCQIYQSHLEFFVTILSDVILFSIKVCWTVFTGFRNMYNMLLLFILKIILFSQCKNIVYCTDWILISPICRYPLAEWLLINLATNMNLFARRCPSWASNQAWPLLWQKRMLVDDVLFKEGGERNPKGATLFQIAYVDTGTIRWGIADLVTHRCRLICRHTKAGRLNAQPSHDSIGVWMPLFC